MIGYWLLFYVKITIAHNNGHVKDKRKDNKMLRNEYKGDVRLLGLDALCAYTGMGKNRAAAFGKNAKAEVRMGRRVLYDKVMIDKAIEAKRRSDNNED